jgi:YVTN family beta-propeller protein
VIATLDVGDDPQGIAYDSGKGEMFVANYVSNTVSVISDSNNIVIATVNGTSYPQDLAYDSGKSEVLVTSYYLQFNLMLPPTTSNTVFAISDYLPLVAPSVSPSSSTVDQGQTSILKSSALTTGASPYVYQWFIEAPNSTIYALITNATSSSYNFATSTATATGNWTFIVQVTDAAGASLNSTAAQVTVNALPLHTSKGFTVLGANISSLIASAITVILVLLISLLLYRRHRKTTNLKQ